MKFSGRDRIQLLSYQYHINKLQLKTARLSATEQWQLDYCKSPYLFLEEKNTILERLSDIFTNSLDIDAKGEISFKPLIENEHRLARIFTEVFFEAQGKGILDGGPNKQSLEQINAYYKNGEPIGIKMFDESFPNLSDNSLVKFSQKEFINDMHQLGRFRISPASFYKQGSLLKAIKDLEMNRNYRIKAIKEAIRGEQFVDFNAGKAEIINGIIPIEIIMNDYFLFSSCKNISRRMPTDFDANSALIIKDKKQFIERFKNKLLTKHPGWEFIEKDVYYYDPYNDLPTEFNQEFCKHLSYPPVSG
ncbi:hypothetical protein I6F66_00005 [Pseudoalteromonas sp. NZS100_1]|uniref:hypothetical protein n=1 Tax=Pseudoalteromonas sp. NZS100_1 TaxID=2792073 RepID=UPI0018CEABE2|nr:hypothetical protein [Pseudoalteromonas sp. NZS100_1]MBH0010465.1 hypothetical protein [Pseudoalteromonas sp. NZS100_1]